MEASSRRPPVSVDSKYYTHTYYDTHLLYAGCNTTPSHLLGALGLRLRDNEVFREAEVLSIDSLLRINRLLINTSPGVDLDLYGLKGSVSIEKKEQIM